MGSPRSTTQDAVHGIKQYIRKNHLQPGDLLPSEPVLCAELGCSRSAVREAVRALSTLDIVDVRHGYGTFVGAMTLEPLVQGLAFRTIVDEAAALKKVIYVVDARESIAQSAGAHLIAACSEADFHALSDLLEKMCELGERGESALAPERAFHHLLATRLENPIMREFYEALWQVQVKSLQALGWELGAESAAGIGAKAALVEALKCGDLVAYQQAVAVYYASMREQIEVQFKVPAPQSEYKQTPDQ
ncbi:GntR family transcriptional regulator [Corynebacterium callunae]|uniref:FadR/GntR family transcriptional regulator n=1 Tax=Corynebacterium callunae TaxID=1721 RepID=UPI0039825C5E